MQTAKLAIAIDGPAGSGKSTAARRVAELLGYDYIDSGAMYRAVALAALRAAIAIEDNDRLTLLARELRIDLRLEDGRTKVWLDGEEVGEEIRRPEVSLAASRVSAIAELRKVLVRKQQEMAGGGGGGGGGVVMEGRDIGSVVLPHADLKVFLTASADVRARRRAQELAEGGQPADFERTKAEVIERDRRDSRRAASPLLAADDAVIVDSTAMEREEVARVIVLLAREKAQRRNLAVP
ncbi:MAG TPA: (d)CMP kinase [Patescibacteria group bacterium]|nr:(d)CMP kinase [Patescibacteria group bacterium]